MSVKLVGGHVGSVEVDFNSTVAQFRELVSRVSSLPADSFRLIMGGKLLNDNKKTLASYGVKDQSKIIVMKSAAAKEQEKVQEQEKEREDRVARLERVKAAAKRMAARSGENSEEYYFELENQNQQKIELPENDRTSLTLGISFHEKGKACLKNRNYEEALDFFLLADESFQLCDPKYTSIIDNWSFLSLDIVWTFFLKKDLNRLQEAMQWLQRAEQGFERSYGRNLERLRALRQGFCPELAYFVRLNLLKAVVSYHLGQKAEALRRIDLASQQASQLHVNEEDVAVLMSLGFTNKQAARALRACSNDQEQATQYLYQKAEEAKERERQRREEAEDVRQAKRYGPTANGKPVKMSLVRALEKMGFDTWVAAEALKQSNNDQEESLLMLLNPDRLALLQSVVHQQQVERQRRAAENLQPRADPLDPLQVAELSSMGFEEPLCRLALQQSEGNLEAALNLLTTPDSLDMLQQLHFQNLDDPVGAQDAADADGEGEDDEGAEDGAGDGAGDGAAENSSGLEVKEDRPVVDEAAQKAAEEEERKKKEQDAQIEQDIEQELLPVIDEDPEAYLDVELDEEVQAIQHYSSVIRQM